MAPDTETQEHLDDRVAVHPRMGRVEAHRRQCGPGRFATGIRNTYYLRFLARVLEEKHYAESNAEAASVWEDFRREAIRELIYGDGQRMGSLVAMSRN